MFIKGFFLLLIICAQLALKFQKVLKRVEKSLAWKNLVGESEQIYMMFKTTKKVEHFFNFIWKMF
jgi:hypothetical protein